MKRRPGSAACNSTKMGKRGGKETAQEKKRKTKTVKGEKKKLKGEP